ncbi:helix-turn-helix domain-containing protein [Bacillus sp. REN10]|uniref:PucR family transcriptional regulator n=1 Tax=Bacillus sp. REN10 TaxID=2782541 RepID=UPI00193B3D96|nr:helix-turn-helix domain-containing protein [Bacillus sp. REN10]
MSVLLEKILSLTDINEITELISQFLKKPIVLEDDQFSLLAYSSYSIEAFDKANKDTIFSKRSPIPILEKFIEEGIIEQLKSIPEPFRVKKIKEIGLNQRVVTSTKYKEQIFGYIWVQETKPPLTHEELDFLHKVSSHIGMLLYKRKQLNLMKNKEKDHFYKKIIDHAYQNENEIKWEAANHNIILPTTFIVNVFTMTQIEDDSFDELTETVRLFANALKHPSHLFLDQQNIVVLIGSRSLNNSLIHESALELTHTIFSQCKDQTVYAGIGNEYSSISKLRNSYLEALEVIKVAKFLGSPTRISPDYHKLGVFRYLEAIQRHNYETQYINQDLMKLKKKDQESQSDLLKTVEVFLENNCRMKQTAEQLFIHPNTLKYRMKQIDELTAINFHDVHVRCQLFIDLQLLKREASQ